MPDPKQYLTELCETLYKYTFSHLSSIYIYATMEELAKRKDLAITNADKGGAVIIMDTNSYIKEANRQLSHKASNKQLAQDPTL